MDMADREGHFLGMTQEFYQALPGNFYYIMSYL